MAFEPIAWPLRGLARTDVKILKLIREAAENEFVASQLNPLLRTWIRQKCGLPA